MGYIICPVYSGPPCGLLPPGCACSVKCPGGKVIKCQNHLSWLPQMWRGSISSLSSPLKSVHLTWSLLARSMDTHNNHNTINKENGSGALTVTQGNLCLGKPTLASVNVTQDMECLSSCQHSSGYYEYSLCYFQFTWAISAFQTHCIVSLSGVCSKAHNCTLISLTCSSNCWYQSPLSVFTKNTSHLCWLYYPLFIHVRHSISQECVFDIL